ncbi:MAG: DMT family transporter [Ignavibacteria bacterium]|nr:DMT family transporter [Ignavibacteria bacterium]
MTKWTLNRPNGSRKESLIRVKTLLCTAFALVAFAANSIFCRLALGDSAIDAATFTTLRLISGAATLLLISSARDRKTAPISRSDWASAALLFLYAVSFSFAYVGLSVGTGALILFGSVQATMILGALRKGERPRLVEWAGLWLALSGLVFLVFPGLTAPSPTRSGLMALAGISWGLYSLRGRTTISPLAETSRSFVLSVPFALLVSIIMPLQLRTSLEGVLLAVLSGALASGLGYVAWYSALMGLTATRAAIVQLAVPVLTALTGVVLLSEQVTLRLILSAALILGGVGVAFRKRGEPDPLKAAE